jgi:hypothetical protein
MTAHWLTHSLVFLGAAVIAVPLARTLGLGAIIGYLGAGIAIGPFGLRLVGDPDTTLEFAEFGVVLISSWSAWSSSRGGSGRYAGRSSAPARPSCWAVPRSWAARPGWRGCPGAGRWWPRSVWRCRPPRWPCR